MKNGKFHGKGIFYSPTGDKYKGEFVEDKFEGYGEYKWNNENQDFYKGEWKNDKRHGYGILYSENKEFYIGEFKNDEYSGIGINYNENFTYEGEFEEHVCKGAGIRIYNSTNDENKLEKVIDDINDTENNKSEKFEGVWEKFDLTGVGDYYLNNVLVYSGEFKEGLFHGKGTKRNQDGTYYEGQFKNGFEHGKGREIKYLENGFKIIGNECEWKNGHKVGTVLKWIDLAYQIMIKISRNKLAKQFNHPMCTVTYPDYYEVIKTPMDFSTIKVI